MTKKQRTELTQALYDKGVGWAVDYHWNVVLEAWNGYLYTQKQKDKGRIEKAFIYNTPDECLIAICKYKNIEVERYEI